MTHSRWIVLLVILLILTNGLWLYRTVDTAVTLSHQSDERQVASDAATQLASLVVELPREGGVKEGYNFVRQHHPDVLAKIRGSTVEFGELVLEYDSGGRLSRVALMGNHNGPQEK
jgi:hypothetical protein